MQLALVYNYLGFMILPLFVALDRIEPALREASKDLGANRVSTFMRVTLPLAGPGIAAGVLLTFIPMCGDFVTATVLGGADGNMIGAMIDSQFKGAQDWPLGSAMAVMMIGAVLLVLLIGAASAGRAVDPRYVLRQMRQGRRMAAISVPEVRATADSAEPHATRSAAMGHGRVGGIVLMFMFVPIVLVILHSFNRGGSFSIWSNATTHQVVGRAVQRRRDVGALRVPRDRRRVRVVPDRQAARGTRFACVTGRARSGS